MRVRTGYSFGTAYGHLDEVLSANPYKGMGIAPITDRASTFGWNKWTNLSSGLRPIYGVELAVSSSPQAKDRDLDYWTFIAKDDLRPLNDLLWRATAQAKYEPILPYSTALKAEGVIKIVGGKAPPDQMQALLGHPDLYVALSPSLNHHAYQTISEQGHNFVQSSDNYYPTTDDEKYYHLIAGRNASSQTYPRHLMCGEEWGALMTSRGIGQTVLDGSVTSLALIASQCKAVMKKGNLVRPQKEESIGDTCYAALEQRGLVGPEYRERLERELNVISDKGFEDYFVIVGDLVRWARTQMLVGPARGSSCGSLVCFLLGITTVDPVKFNLLFERFIDLNRSDLPDIDIDFSEQYRSQAFHYVEKKYGKTNVARLGTVSLYRQRSALHAGGIAYNIPKWRCDAVAEIIEPRAAGDEGAFFSLRDAFATLPAAKKLAEEIPQIVNVAKLEGHPRHYSQHAAGLILTDAPVRDYVGIDTRTNATQCDKRDAEALNLLKIDCLGLTQLSVFEDYYELIGENPNDLFALPLDDQKAFDVFNRGNFLGIFQFNGKALQGISQQTEIKSIDDLFSICALGRPGPINSGAATQWVARKRGSQVLYPDPLFEEILKPTMGVLIYQEQIMQICRQAGLDWPEVTAVRKAMGKSQGAMSMEKWRPAFVRGCVAQDVPRDVADRLWGEMCEFGAYAFNKSHAVAYSIISYWCAVAKAYHPVEFAAATLTHEHDHDRQIAILRELDAQGIKYRPFDPDLSTGKWTTSVVDGERVLIGPVSTLVGVGPKTMQEFLSAKKHPWETMSDRALKLLGNGKTKLDSLWPIRDALQLFVSASELPIRAETLPIDKLLPPDYNSGWDSIVVLALVDRLAVKNENDEVSVKKRGFEVNDGRPTTSLNVFIRDDTGQMFAKVPAAKFVEVGQPMIDTGKAERALYAFRGRVRDGHFRMLTIEKAMYLGEKS